MKPLLIIFAAIAVLRNVSKRTLIIFAVMFTFFAYSLWQGMFGHSHHSMFGEFFLWIFVIGFLCSVFKSVFNIGYILCEKVCNFVKPFLQKGVNNPKK